MAKRRTAVAAEAPRAAKSTPRSQPIRERALKAGGEPTPNGHTGTPRPEIDWLRVARVMLLSRSLDQIEEERLVHEGHIAYQISSRGHELAQVLLALAMNRPHDAAAVYYRSRPFVLAQGLTPEEALLSTMGKAGGASQGRDIGVVHNMPSRGGANVLPTSGDVGAQYTPAAGWAQAIHYRADVLGQEEWRGCMAAALGGDGSTAANGFWAALNIVTVGKLPYLFFIEDNGYGISVPSTVQTPNGSLHDNLASFGSLRIITGSGTDPEETAERVAEAVAHIRSGAGPVLLQLQVPRLSGHSFVDTQTYKCRELLERERANDPLPKLREFLMRHRLVDEREWLIMESEAHAAAEAAAEAAVAAHGPSLESATVGVFHEKGRSQATGGLLPEVGEEEFERRCLGTGVPAPEGPRVNLLDAVRHTLNSELERNDRVVVFGEDVGRKGGVHGATVDMQLQFGAERVFDTSLNEEGIMGRAVGMALAGLMPVPEIQFRKYADPAYEQINDCGTMRWRTAGNYAAPMVVRIPVGFGKKTGDPWHSVSGESVFAHLIGWRVIMPSNAEDAVGLLRTALRGNDPCFFLEHRALLDTREGRRRYPGDDFTLPLGVANIVREGTDVSVITWGEMVHRALEAADCVDASVEIIDLRTVSPWDEEAVLASVRKTARCLIVHEDTWTCGFGAEIAATVAQKAFRWLDAPIERVATPDCPIPYNHDLMESIVPTVSSVADAINRIVRY